MKINWKLRLFKLRKKLITFEKNFHFEIMSTIIKLRTRKEDDLRLGVLTPFINLSR